ncbi:Transmembrane protein [Actinidia chinensis var. chinensis]|uniref:Transmembrane protein n=1 Tax=Actinidia chinensis var. chinensis TaxID=1590841 RepID=A0A2R6R3J8_ACTCC|nr:Transmembrane protein [Actinidia chinensis var. chinensis]
MQTLAVSFAYMVYDQSCCLFGKQFKLDNSIHHLVCILGFGAALAYEKCGSELVAALWISEISTPFLHLREILKELGYRDSDINLATDVCSLCKFRIRAISFAILFTFARMVCGPYLTYVTVSANNPLLIKAMAVGLQLVSFFWFYKIARLVKYKLTRRAATSKDLVEVRPCKLL